MGIDRRGFLKHLAGIGSAAVVGNTTKALAQEEFTGYPDRFGVLVDLTVCIGCRRCEWACKEVNKLPNTDRSSNKREEHMQILLQSSINSTILEILKSLSGLKSNACTAMNLLVLLFALLRLSQNHLREQLFIIRVSVLDVVTVWLHVLSTSRLINMMMPLLLKLPNVLSVLTELVKKVAYQDA